MSISKSKQKSRLFDSFKGIFFRGYPLVSFAILSLLQIFIMYSFCLYALLTRSNRHLSQDFISLLPSLRRYQLWGDQVGLSKLVNDILFSYAGCLFIHIFFLFANAFILLYRYKLGESAPLNINKAVFVGILIISIYPNAEIIWGPFAMGQTGLFSNSLFSGNETLSYFRYALLAFANFFLFVLLGGGLYRYPKTDWQSRERDMGKQ